MQESPDKGQRSYNIFCVPKTKPTGLWAEPDHHSSPGDLCVGFQEEEERSAFTHPGAGCHASMLADISRS